MLEEAWDVLGTALGLDREVAEVGTAQMALRTVIVYVVTLVLVRLGNKRFLSRATAFDVIVAIMVGSIVSRAINGSAPFFPTLLGAGASLVALHWVFATVAFHTDWFGTIVKGEPVLLIRDGEIVESGMQNASLSRRDLDEQFRMQGREPDPSTIRLGYLERNGRISLIPEEREPRVVEVDVRDGIQTVRIEIA